MWELTDGEAICGSYPSVSALAGRGVEASELRERRCWQGRRAAKKKSLPPPSNGGFPRRRAHCSRRQQAAEIKRGALRTLVLECAKGGCASGELFTHGQASCTAPLGPG